jgi:hypothetical protein
MELLHGEWGLLLHGGWGLLLHGGWGLLHEETLQGRNLLDQLGVDLMLRCIGLLQLGDDL